jgi:NAD+ synthetase
MDYKKITENIRANLANYIKTNNIQSLVLGVSGGIDSALAAALAAPVAEDLGIPLIGRSISITTNTISERTRAEDIGLVYCDDFKEVDLSSQFEAMRQVDSMEATLDKDDSESITYKIRMGNIKARMRMIHLYNLASKHKGMVLSTDNLTEYNLGFWTIMGDSPADYAPMQNLWKTEVYELSEYLSKVESEHKHLAELALKHCINADATDGLGITNTDLDQIIPEFKGTSREGYAIVDDRLKDHIEGRCTNLDDPVVLRHMNTQFKRDWPFSISRSDLMKGIKND